MNTEKKKTSRVQLEVATEVVDLFKKRAAQSGADYKKLLAEAIYLMTVIQNFKEVGFSVTISADSKKAS